MLGTLAQAQAATGHVAEARATIEEALTKSERDEERWWMPELLRIKAEVISLAEGGEAAPTAELHLQDALAWARPQGALSFGAAMRNRPCSVVAAARTGRAGA